MIAAVDDDPLRDLLWTFVLYLHAQQQTDDHVRSVATPGFHRVDEIARAKQLLDRGSREETSDQLQQRVFV